MGNCYNYKFLAPPRPAKSPSPGKALIVTVESTSKEGKSWHWSQCWLPIGISWKVLYKCGWLGSIQLNQNPNVCLGGYYILKFPRWFNKVGITGKWLEIEHRYFSLSSSSLLTPTYGNVCIVLGLYISVQLDSLFVDCSPGTLGPSSHYLIHKIFLEAVLSGSCLPYLPLSLGCLINRG
jgi:hypothetical protein